jgi:type II secretory pathway pseudopilin PulG
VRGARYRAFSLLDVLVSMAVIAILISILLPSLGPVQETARRVACQSNVRQVGLGVVMYADDWQGQLPPSAYLPVPNGSSVQGPREPQNMLTIRRDLNDHGGGWDGIGWLYGRDYLTAPKVFYCPSHRGENPYSRFASTWNDGETEIIGNYHFRGMGPMGANSGLTTRNLYQIDPAQSSLIADGMRLQSDCNHRVGVNFFRADLTVHWYPDPTGALMRSLPSDKNSAVGPPIDDAWGRMDQSANGGN